jgi:DinB superfamily
MDSHLKHWNDQHRLLRRLLLKDKAYQSALPIFLEHHAAVHAAKLHTGAHWSWHDEVLNGLTPEQMRYTPKGSPHSVAWRIWHMTRIEDVTLNVLLTNGAQVFTSGKWIDKLEIDYMSVGNEMSDADIAKLSETINLKALFAYRLAVGKRTRMIVKRLNLDLLSRPPAPDRVQRLVAERAVQPPALWLLDFWGGHPAANLLLMPATRHPFVHLNEIKRLLPKLRRV